MTNAIRYRGVVIEDVPGAPWTVAYGWRDDVLNFAVLRACPDYASDELRLACWDSLVASVFGECDLCGAVMPTPQEMKTAGPDQRVFLGQVPMPHRDECPCSDWQLQALDRRDSSDGEGTPTDYSEQSLAVLNEYLNMAIEVLR